MDAREDLPKVSIETEQDWRRIQRNLSDAFLATVSAKLDTHGQPGDNDTLSPLAHQFLETLFDIARPNLRINGRTTDEPGDDEDGLDMEPFDEALDRHIWSLSDQRLKWDKEIADRRRSRPDDIRKLVIESSARHHDCHLDVSEEPDPSVDFNPKQIDSTLQQTLSNAASLAPRHLQSQQSQVDRMRLVSAQVKALKH